MVNKNNLDIQETELVHGTYGDDVGVAYAESIKNFSKNCEYASFIVDNLLGKMTSKKICAVMERRPGQVSYLQHMLTLLWNARRIRNINFLC